jgi:hypothetical protein
MKSWTRPIGVTLLSLMAFAACSCLLFLLGDFVFTILTRNELPSLSDGLALSSICVLLLVEAACFLVLAWISFTAALDLWKLRERGRLLARASMALALLLGLPLLLIREKSWILTGAGLCVFGVSFIIYLQVPAMQRSFAAPPVA